MEFTCLHNKCISPSLTVLSRVSISFSNLPKRAVSFHRRRRNLCFATLVDGKRTSEVVSKRGGEEEDEFGDLKSWMHKNGLPPCKVVLKERPSHDKKLRPIHYVAASEDLQVFLGFYNLWFFFWKSICFFSLLIVVCVWAFCRPVMWRFRCPIRLLLHSRGFWEMRLLVRCSVFSTFLIVYCAGDLAVVNVHCWFHVVN